MTYAELLVTWALRYTPDGATEVRVDLGYSDHHDPTFGGGGVELHPEIRYLHNCIAEYVSLDDEDASSTIGGLLTELFAIADRPAQLVVTVPPGVTARDDLEKQGYERPELDEDGRDR